MSNAEKKHQEKKKAWAKKKRHLLFGGIVVLACVLTGCASQEQTKKTGEFKATDYLGVEVAFDQAPQSIVCLSPSDTEVLFALGLDKEIIAVGEYCNYPEAAAQKTVLGSGDNTSIEQILALQPDLLITPYISAKMEEFTRLLSGSNCQLFVTNPTTLVETYDTILAVGNLTGKGEKAEEIVDNMKARVQSMENKKQGRQAYRVYFEVSPLQFGLWSAGTGTFQDEALQCVGSQNIFADIKGWSAISEEEVIARNPQVIITSTSDYPGDPVAEILSRPNWQEVDAVKNKRVYLIDNDTLVRPTPRLIEGIENLAKFLYED